MTTVLRQVCMSDTNISATGLDGSGGGPKCKYVNLLSCWVHISMFEIQRTTSSVGLHICSFVVLLLEDKSGNHSDDDWGKTRCCFCPPLSTR